MRASIAIAALAAVVPALAQDYNNQGYGSPAPPAEYPPPAGYPVSQISDGQPQAPTGYPSPPPPPPPASTPGYPAPPPPPASSAYPIPATSAPVYTPPAPPASSAAPPVYTPPAPPAPPASSAAAPNATWTTAAGSYPSETPAPSEPPSAAGAMVIPYGAALLAVFGVLLA